MSHIRNVGLQRISYSNKPGACQTQKRCSKSPHNFTKRRTPFWRPKNGPRLGSVFCVDIARYSFSNMEPKKGVHFSTSKFGFLFVVFSVVAIALLRLRGWLIFIRISNSGRPTVLTVGSWFVVWLLNNRPALHTVAYVGTWLINSQATNHEPYQKCRPAKNFIFKQTWRVSDAKTLQQKPSQFHQKATPVLVSKKRAPFGVRFLC